MSRSEFDAFMNLATGAGTSNISMGSTGVPIVTSGAGGAGGVGNMVFSHPNMGWPTASGSFNWQSPIGGKSIPMNAAQAFTKPSMGAALARFAAKVAGPLAVGMAAYDLLQEMNIAAHWNPTTLQNEFDRTTSYAVFTLSPSSCGLSGSATLGPSQIGPLAAACYDYLHSHGGTTILECHASGSNTIQCTRTGAGPVDYTGTPAGFGSSTTPLTEQDVADAIAVQSGWPSSSNISKAMAQAMNGYGAQSLPLTTSGNPVVTPTGATQVASTPKTTTSSDGGSQTETQKCDLYQAGGGGSSTLEWRCWTEKSVTTPSKTTTSTTLNPDGTTSTTTTTIPSSTVTSSTNPINPDESTSTDTPPTLDKLSRSTYTFNIPTVAFSGTAACPAAYTVSASVMSFSHDFAFSYQPLCDWMPTVRALLLVVAAALAAWIVADGFRIN